ncbi:unnamed protein product [Spodoptera exigua]|nr:unnamed protein product [Spodoptera exigua]
MARSRSTSADSISRRRLSACSAVALCSSLEACSADSSAATRLRAACRSSDNFSISLCTVSLSLMMSVYSAMAAFLSSVRRLMSALSRAPPSHCRTTCATCCFRALRSRITAFLSCVKS